MWTRCHPGHSSDPFDVSKLDFGLVDVQQGHQYTFDLTRAPTYVEPTAFDNVAIDPVGDVGEEEGELTGVTQISLFPEVAQLRLVFSMDKPGEHNTTVVGGGEAAHIDGDGN